jgi:HNH endonuclease
VRIYSLWSSIHWCVVPSFSLSAAALLLIFAQWDKKGYSEIVVDPYSVPGASKSSTSRLMTDTRHMNSIDNGLLLCLQHHSDFDNHLFSIHPDVGIYILFLICVLKPCMPRPILSLPSIFELGPSQEWKLASRNNAMNKTQIPPPHKTLLYDNFRASKGRWMMAASEEYEEEDSLEDQDEVPQPVGISDDSCLIATEMSDDIAPLQGDECIMPLAVERGMVKV